MIRVLLADDHAMVREGMARILAETEDIRATAQAASGAEVLRLVREQAFDALVLDLGLPDRSGLDVLHQVRTIRPSLPILVVTMFTEAQYVQRAFKAGARGYISKENAASELVEAIRRVCRGSSYLSADLLETVIPSQGQADPLDTLSDREFQVFMGIARGRRMHEIAKELAISAKTVSTYRARILEKLHLETTSELIRYAIERGLI